MFILKFKYSYIPFIFPFRVDESIRGGKARMDS